ncbi:MAG TPA: protein translocase subunit SecD [Dehalococcoidales bacterium]|nr:protein translocase subunit SecD [Dehalococcoidales bacterium]
MRKNTIVFLIIIAVVTLAGLVVFPLSTSTGGTLFDRPIKLGLDLMGGVRLVYQADLSNVPEAQHREYMQADEYVIRTRVDRLGATEPNIKLLGGNRILVELPGIDDINEAVDLIGRTAILEFGELTEAGDPAAKWTVGEQKWKPAMGELDGIPVALTSSFFKTNTSITTDSLGKLLLVFEWDSQGSILSDQITGRLVKTNAPLGIFSGDELLSAPSVMGHITDRGQIEGMEQQEASQLRDLLNAGRLQVPLTLISNENVSSTLGAEFVSLAFISGLIGLLLVMIFMIIYYRLPGLLASVALLIYVLVNLTVFKLLPVTLTLGGLAGFIASIGMAVDANILIFERMKEELRAGRTVGAAIEAGFKRAWSSILHCNVTTFIACGIMYFMGSSTVVASTLITGFALTLFIGVLVSMVSAITVTRTLLRLFIGTSIAQKVGLFRTAGGK